MTDINSILDNATQWTTEGVTKPSIVTGQLWSLSMMSRGIVCYKLTSEDELTGVIDRHTYSVDSYEAWTVGMVSSTSFADLESIIGCVKRICAEYSQVSGHETYLTWMGGTYKHFNNKRFEFKFTILRMKSLQAEF